MQLKVLSWNIWQGKYLDKIIKFLELSSPDIIALQEVIESETVENIAKQISDKLGYKYVYCNAFETDRHETVYKIGNAILSKYEITSESCHFLSSIDQYKNSAETEPRVATEVTMKINGKDLRAIAIHLAYSHKFQASKMRNLQVDNLIKLLQEDKTVLMGDFNSNSDGEAVKRVSKVLVNTDKKLTKPTWTVYPFDYRGFKETKLNHRIDYIFVSKDITVKNFEVGESDGSDHLPITAVIEV